MYPAYCARFFVVVVLAALVALAAFAQNPDRLSGPAVNDPCMECGVIYEIRPITSERPVAKTTMEEGAPPVGPTINFPLTRDPDAKAEVDVFGSKKMREGLEETVYEVVVRFDDDRFTRVEVSDVSNLQVGDRVHVHQNRIEPVDQP